MLVLGSNLNLSQSSLAVILFFGNTLCHLILGISQITNLWSLLVFSPLYDLLLVTLEKSFGST